MVFRRHDFFSSEGGGDEEESISLSLTVCLGMGHIPDNTLGLHSFVGLHYTM